MLDSLSRKNGEITMADFPQKLENCIKEEGHHLPGVIFHELYNEYNFKW